MKYIIAVSGGGDSVVLLDMLLNEGKHELVVAHFDHGIRPDSAADARFVAEIAKRHGLKFETAREQLGTEASEELARTRRYEFLARIAKKHNAKIVTAHHAGDIVETIAINLQRGTGWRGLAVLNNPQIERPLLSFSKRQLYDYALAHGLEWVEDETNTNPKYQRNRLRKQLAHLNEAARQELLTLHQKQCEITKQIDTEADTLRTSSRYFYTHIDHTSALEVLRNVLAANSVSLTRPQRERLLLAIKTFQPGQILEAGDGTNIIFSRREFVVKRRA